MDGRGDLAPPAAPPGPPPGSPPAAPPGPPPPPAAAPLPPLPPRPGLPGSPAPARPAPSTAVLALPLGGRALLRQSLDLLTRRDAGLRGASFYIGLVVLATTWPMAVVLGLLLTVPDVLGPALGSPLPGASGGAPAGPPGGQEAWLGWLALAMVPALPGYLAASVEARTLATAVIGGRVEGRPLVLRESIGLARRRFWPLLGAQALVGILAGIVSSVVQLGLLAALGPASEASFGLSLALTVVLSLPFVYVPAGIVLGEVGIFEAIGRSWRLVRLRARLAVIVALFAVAGQFVVLFGLSAGVDVLARVLVGTGVAEDFPRPLVVPVAATLSFAVGTLTFLVEAIAAAPAVHAFAALTRYTHGLQDGRDHPARGWGLFSPWFTPGLAAAALAGLLVLAGAILSLPA